MATKKPVRSDFKAGSAGEKAYAAALAKWNKDNAGKNNSGGNDPSLDVPAIRLPGLKTGVDAVQASNWFKFTAAKAAKGTPARTYYDEVTATMARLGIASKDWQSVWDDAVTWVQTPGSGSTGDPKMFMSSLNPSDYADKTAAKKYGTTKSKQTTVTKYSASGAGADLNKATESELGRTAYSSETAAYLKAVNERAKKEPSVYEGTTTTSPGKGGVDNSVTQATSTTGFDPTLFAQNFARSMPDYAESFAAKNVLKIIEGLIGPDRTAIGKVVQ
jgi:hypothetical protein